MTRAHVVVSFPSYDRILPRMARELGQIPGWTVGEKPDPSADANMYLPYLEIASKGKAATKTVAYFTHIEPGAKARQWEAAAKQVDLRIITAPQYYDALAAYGPTVLVTPPVDLKHFTPGKREPNPVPVVGVSGFVYAGGRKGEKLVKMAASSELGKTLVWKGAGKGWPVPTRLYSWDQLPGFYRGLDVYLCAATIEGVPMPPLEAMACGVRCVIPYGVGLLDELPDLPDIYRYEAGNMDSLTLALFTAAFAPRPVDRKALRAAVSEYTADNWRDGHVRAFAELCRTGGQTPGDKPALQEVTPDLRTHPGPAVSIVGLQITHHTDAGDVGSVRPEMRADRGIYVVAYGEPARVCATRLLRSIAQHMPDIPVMLVGDQPLHEGEAHFLVAPRGDIGARSVKVQIYDRAPAEWQYVLYLDADTELVAPVPFLFEVLERGWDFTICKNPSRFHSAEYMVRPDNGDECKETFALWGTNQMMQWNGGVFGFARNERTRAFFGAWHREWLAYGKRDQAALLRALWAHPLRLYPLGNEWNLVPTYDPVSRSAGIVHHVTEAREWGKGIIAQRGDSPEAFAQVARNRRRMDATPPQIVNGRAFGRTINEPRGGPLVKVDIGNGRAIRMTAKEAAAYRERQEQRQAEKAQRQVQNKMIPLAGVLNK